MNPLTLVKRIQKINSAEASLGISDDASWHAKYKDSAYVFVGGIPYDLTEGDLLAVFSQYGEIVDVNLVRDKATGKSKGFAFLAYEDQRSTTLAVDNLNGANVLGRIVRVDHVSNYKKKEEEDEEAEQQKREARGVCYAFQKGECSRGASCKFSHDEQRNANTGWGAKDEKSAKNESSARWGHDKYDGRLRSNEKTNQASAGGTNGVKIEDKEFNSRSTDRDEHRSRIHGDERNNYQKDDKRESKKQSERYEKENWDRQRGRRDKEDREIRDVEKQLDVYEGEGRDRGAGKHDGGTKKKDRDRRKEGLSEEYEKEGLDIADEKDESDINSDRREKGRYLRHNGDERRSGQRDRDLHESRKHSRYEDSTPHRRSEEDRSLHRRERRH